VRAAVEDFIGHYRNLGLSGSALWASEVAALERHLGLILPAAYRAYLLVAGAYPPPNLVGSDCHNDYLYKLREWADILLGECGHPFALPADSVVFLMHQGYQFFYFRADGGTDDPAVWYYYENWSAPEQRYNRFSDWVAEIVL